MSKETNNQSPYPDLTRPLWVARAFGILFLASVIMLTLVLAFA